MHRHSVVKESRFFLKLPPHSVTVGFIVDDKYVKFFTKSVNDCRSTQAIGQQFARIDHTTQKRLWWEWLEFWNDASAQSLAGLLHSRTQYS